MKSDSRSWNKDAVLAYVLLRLTLGLNICMHGLVRWASGPGKFSASLMNMFQNSLLPIWAIESFGHALPFIEAIIGLAIFAGFKTRLALTSGMVLMMVLMFGSSLRQDWQVVGLQLIYSVTYAILLATERMNRYSVDSLIHSSSGNSL